MCRKTAEMGGLNMRLLNIKYHDYWHVGAKYGADPNIIYEQKHEQHSHFVSMLNKHAEYIITQFRRIKDFSNAIDKYSRGIRVKDKVLCVDAKTWEGGFFDTDGRATLHLFGFCGKFIPFIAIKILSEKEYFYSLDSFVEFCENNKSINCPVDTKNKISEFFKLYTDMKIPDEFFIENSCLYFLIDSMTPYSYGALNKANIKLLILREPVLKNYQFYKLKDPYTCFQELSQFLSNVFVSTSSAETVEVSDKTKIQKHGFDKKSFRKEKDV